MARTQVVPWFKREHYDAIRRLVGDEAMPDTFDQWLKETTEEVQEREALGVVMEKAVVDPDKFAAWCLASGLDHNLTALRAFAVAAARKQSDHGA